MRLLRRNQPTAEEKPSGNVTTDPAVLFPTLVPSLLYSLLKVIADMKFWPNSTVFSYFVVSPATVFTNN
jgi:hypothetical protein